MKAVVIENEAKMSSKSGWLRRFKDARRMKRFQELIDSLPHGDFQEDRKLLFTPPVTTAPSRELCVSSIDYRVRLMSERKQDHKMSELILACADGEYSLLFDIGANYGEFVASAIGTVDEIVAIEANPIVARCLKLSFSEENEVRVLAHAVSDQNGELTMRINPQYSGGNRLISEDSAPSSYFIEACTFAMNVTARRLYEVLIEERGSHQRPLARPPSDSRCA